MSAVQPRRVRGAGSGRRPAADADGKGEQVTRRYTLPDYRRGAPVSAPRAEPKQETVSLPAAAPVVDEFADTEEAEHEESAPPAYHVMIGAVGKTPQYGLLGKVGELRVALDLNGCNTISLFGVQGGGKSYTLGVIAEMASLQVPHVNELPSPLGTVLFHYHRSDTYEPEHASAVRPNEKKGEIDRLLQDYGASPAGLGDIVLLTPEAKVIERQAQYPEIQVEALKFSSAEIGPEGWKFLLGAVGNKGLYVRQMVSIMRQLRGQLTVDRLRDELKAANLEPNIAKLAEDRISLSAQYIDDDRGLSGLLRPGRTVIVDLRDEWIEKEEALGLFVVLARIFGATRFNGEEFSKLFVFDEAHKYITQSDLIGEVEAIIREMRHLKATVLIASQDPLSVPRSVIELSSVLVLHRMTSPQWLKHLRGAIAALEKVTIGMVATLSPGEALIWSRHCTDRRFTIAPQRVQIRPRFTAHGGGTKTAVG